MKAVRRKTEDEHATERGRLPKPLDPGETRAVILASAALLVFLYFIKLILLPFILPAILAYISTPLLNWLARRTHWPRLLFAVVLFLLFLGIGSTAGYFAGTRVISEGRALAGDLQGILQKFVTEALGNKAVTLFGHPMDAQQIVQTLLQRFRDRFGQADVLALLTGYGIGAIMGAFLSVVLLFYFLVSGERIARGLLWMIPPHRRPLVKRIWSRLDPILLRYFIGMILVMMYATAASYVGLALVLGIHHAVVLALLTGILETVPVIGPTSAAVLAGLVSLRTATGLMSILDYALYATALRLSIDQVVGPIVLGRAAHVHPVLIIFCFLAGGIVFGIPGVILAVPAALLVKSTLATLYGDRSD
jgi:predicted PurR-regulated permease PerM